MITFVTKKITPRQARVFLVNNPKNRKVDEIHVLFLSQQMLQDGAWKQNGDTIVISDKGTLLNGQHRLLALIKANISMIFTICTGVEEEAIKSMDSGRPRSLANIFEMEGHKYASHKASFATALLRFKNKLFHHDTGYIARNSVSPSMESRYDFYMKHHRKADKWVKYAVSNKKLMDFNPTNLALALFILERVHKEPIVLEFLEKMFNGGDYKYSPTHTIPHLIRLRKKDDVIRFRWEDFYIVMQGFELWLAKKPLNKIDYKELRKIAPSFYESYKFS